MRHRDPLDPHPDVVVGLDTPDDAAVVRVTDSIALVQTVDFFTPIVDDPYDWGRIAAANALSDVYAMGASPKTALNLVGWPRKLGFDLLARVLEGGAAVCRMAGASVVGGHSIDDPEPKYGLAVTGIADPARIVRKTGSAAPADLILTKPLGTGIICTAIKDGAILEDDARPVIETMASLNDHAAAAMMEVGVYAATDVTGFGLVGHLLEMLQTRLSATISMAAVPIFPRAIELAAAGFFPGGSRRNAGATSGRVRVDDRVDPRRVDVLYDAQTSGGLLIASSSDRTAALVSSLRDRGVAAAVIGQIYEGDGTIEVTQ